MPFSTAHQLFLRPLANTLTKPGPYLGHMVLRHVQF